MKIETSLGSLALKVSGKAKASAAEALENAAAASLVYRAGASKLFGKKSGHARDEAFGEKLANDAKAAVELVLAPFFDGIAIEASEYVAKPSSATKALQSAHDALKAAGVKEADLKAAFPALYSAEALVKGIAEGEATTMEGVAG